MSNTFPTESRTVPFQQFQALYATSERILQAMYQRARMDATTIEASRDALDGVAEEVRRFFKAESCGIFLIQWNNPSLPPLSIPWNKPFGLRLAGTSNEMESTYSRFTVSVDGEPNSFVLSLLRLFQEKKLPEIFPEDVLNKLTPAHFNHLRNQRCFSCI